MKTRMNPQMKARTIPQNLPLTAGRSLVLLTVFEVLTCGANPPRGDLLLLHPTAVRFAAGDEGGVFVPQAVWAAVDNLLAHDDCRIFFVVLKSNATVPLSILIYPYCYRVLE